MLDPFPFAPPPSLQRAVQPLASALHLKTLPLHAHEVLFAFLLYTLIQWPVSPLLSPLLFPRYRKLPARTRLNWDVHVVSLVQSSLINTLALWVVWTDGERGAMGAAERVWGYTGAGGLVQAFACGYFLWDLVISVVYVRIFGVGMLAHAVSALAVFSLGFRPFVNFYGPVFILYELSSPFLNVHWFCDKLSLTGSRLQLYNGLLLILTFFSCRLCWGTYQSVRVFSDIWQVVRPGPAARGRGDDGAEPLAAPPSVPPWLAASYLVANVTLNGLNFYWFGKMIETVRKRFPPPLGTARPQPPAAAEQPAAGEDEKVLVEGIDIDTEAEVDVDDVVSLRKKVLMNGHKPAGAAAQGVVANGHRTVEAEGMELRSRRRG